MKKILVLSFMHEDPLILKEFELLKEHYNKIIDYFCFPIKYYGVRATEEGETRIDEENQMIWLHTDSIKEYDKNLVQKVVDCFTVIEHYKIEYDIIVKGNTSSYLNLIMLNNILQHEKEECVYTGQVSFLQHSIMNFFVRGNCICLLKNHIKTIINSNIYKIEKELVEKIPYFENDILNVIPADDVVISSILINNAMLYTKQCGQLMFDFPDEIVNPANDIEDILKVGVVCYKMYNISKDKTSTYSKNSIDGYCPDIVLLKMIINFVEKRYISDRKYTRNISTTHLDV